MKQVRMKQHTDECDWTRIRAYTECPYCHATSGARIVLSMNNLFKLIANGTLVLIGGELFFPFRLQWKCSFCKNKFQVASRKKSNEDSHVDNEENKGG